MPLIGPDVVESLDRSLAACARVADPRCPCCGRPTTDALCRPCADWAADAVCGAEQ